jgi:hypothetical protein
MVIVGSHTGTSLSASPQAMIANEWEILGSRNVTKRELAEVVALVAAGRVKPIVTGTYPLEAAEALHLRLRNRKSSIASFWSRDWRKHANYFEPKDLPVIEKNEANITTLANSACLEQTPQVGVLFCRRHKSDRLASDAERFVYVISGRGQAYVSEQAFPLDAESMLWLEKDDTFYLEAGMDGLEVLLCRAPASE